MSPRRSASPVPLVPALLVLAFAFVAAPAQLGIAAPGDVAPPALVPGLAYDEPFFPDARHELPVPSPEELLGHRIAERFASPEQITRCLLAWDEASPRVSVVEYARTYEGRPLHYAIVTSPENQARLEEIRAAMGRLADPRGMDAAEADRLLAELPAVGWFAYSIHGNETSGADAALAFIHHLAADATAETEELLRDLVVIVDPLMNPDGRARFFQEVAEHRGRSPNLDDQSMLRIGDWPGGRTNHYYFDLNRDFLVAAHPETRGRMRELAAWYPLLLVDGHEMMAQDTYLFSPPRDPINPHLPPSRLRWGEVFAADQARAFDRHGWPYYTGEWNDEWYLGYSSWTSYRAGLFILYEQARVSEDAIRQGGGKLLSYPEAVHHQIVSSLANLRTLHANREALKRDFLQQRRAAVAADGPYAGRTWAIVPAGNVARERRFLELMDLHGVEVHELIEPYTAREGRDALGRRLERHVLPAGTLLIGGRQPEAYLAAALLDLDPRLQEETLRKERQELMRYGSSRMYDVTAWSLPLLFGLEAFELRAELPRGARRVAAATWVPPGTMGLVELTAASQPADHPPVAWAVDGRDDRSVAFAARLLEQGLQVRLADKAFTGGGWAFPRGTVVVTGDDNRVRAQAELADLVADAAAAWGLAALPLGGGLGAGDQPDLGGRHFRRLEAPSIALVGRGGASGSDFGEIWYALDHRLGIRHTHLDEGRLGGTDLRRYNVVVLPDRWGRDLTEKAVAELRDWVEGGGTLIAVGSAASALLKAKEFPSEARDLPEALADLGPYELAVWREWLAQTGSWTEGLDVWSHTVPEKVPAPPLASGPARQAARDGAKEQEAGTKEPGEAAKEGAGREKGGGPEAEARRLDKWLSLFMPQGAVLAARVDTLHWLTVGCGQVLPVLTGSVLSEGPVLLTAGGVEAPVRFGVFAPAAGRTDAPARAGWSPVPPGHEVRLRMSGLLWPEAAHRLASSAYLAREPRGRGQVVFFAGSAAFRAATPGTERLLLNALVYGPGMGASAPIRP